jgi:catechol 2,3-dioxygenase-like lactoylglutathione lyase family enzyme
MMATSPSRKIPFHSRLGFLFSPMKLSSAIPLLRIFDEDKAKEFYQDFLGFTTDWENRYSPQSPLYTQVSKDGCILHLTGHHGDSCPGSAIRIQTSDVAAYSQHLRDKKYKHSNPGHQVTQWDTIEMTIADPFGNKLTFYQPTDS